MSEAPKLSEEIVEGGMTELEETMAVVAKRIAAHYRISPDEALRAITNALKLAPEKLDTVEDMYWFTAGWMAGRGRDAKSAGQDTERPSGREMVSRRRAYLSRKSRRLVLCLPLWQV